MKEDKLLMSEKERTRYHLMRLVKSGRLSLKEASDKMGLSYRQSKRVKAARVVWIKT